MNHLPNQQTWGFVEMIDFPSKCDSFSSLSNSVPPPPGAVHCILLNTLFPTRRTGRRVLLIAGCFFGLVLPSCQKALLAADEERSQFQRYDRAREQDQPGFYMDEFGRRRPNLRGRLEARE